MDTVKILVTVVLALLVVYLALVLLGLRIF
jgi:hypothetical protein